MGRMNALGRGGLHVAGILFVVLFSGALLCLQPAVVAAQDYEAMMPEALSREVRATESEYHKVMDAVSVAETERLAKASAGAAEADLRALDDKVGQLVTKAEKLKVQADYLKELYNSKKREYKTR
jgi:hypothetical protein